MPITQRSITANGLQMAVTEAGSGPLVVLCHGFPETSHSWRHQLPALAAAGFHAVAPDMRGYGGTGGPQGRDSPAELYSLINLVGDMVALVAALGERRAAIVGHDWGAPVAWTAALLRPDVFSAVAGLSVPYSRRASRVPTEALMAASAAAGGKFYMLRFAEQGAEREWDADPRAALKKLLSAGMFGAGRWSPMLKSDDALAGLLGEGKLPPWLTEDDLDAYAAAFSRSGFRGPLNWYANLDRNWRHAAAFEGLAIRQPALFMVGEKDVVRSFAGAAEKALPETVPGLRRVIVVPGAGHWLQQEAPEAVNEALVTFLHED